MATKVLFICHGNICRSVSAQYIFQNLVNQRGCADRFVIDSAAATRCEATLYHPHWRHFEIF